MANTISVSLYVAPPSALADACPTLTTPLVDFSNVLTKRAIEQLAEADTYELVHEVQEFFADFAPILPSLFSLDHIPSASRPLYGSSSSTWDSDALKRSAQGLAAVLLSLKKKPIIRYQKMSAMARKLGGEVQVREGRIQCRVFTDGVFCAALYEVQRVPLRFPTKPNSTTASYHRSPQ